MKTIRRSLLALGLVALLSTPAAWGICTFGTFGDDTMYGTSGADCLDGNPGNDLIYGMAGDDGLNGYTGDDTIYGGPGDDILSGCACFGVSPPSMDSDYLNGGEGDDYCDGGGEVDCEY